MPLPEVVGTLVDGRDGSKNSLGGRMSVREAHNSYNMQSSTALKIKCEKTIRDKRIK